MSFWFDTIKFGYDNKLPGYTAEGIMIFVDLGWITTEEYEMIIGVEHATPVE